MKRWATLLLALGCSAPAPELQVENKYERAEGPETEAAPEPVAEPEPPALDPASLLRPPPEGWVSLPEHIDQLRIDIRYHTADNFTGAPLPGYAVPGAWLQKAPADALAAVQADLSKQGLGLLVYDAYRPRRGTLGMVAWAERTDQVHLLDNGYIARVSGHNRGNTIDLTVISLETGEPLDMGTPWDTLTEASHTMKAEGQALENRLILRSAMTAHGWQPYYKEWWHFSFPMKPTPKPRDVPYACFEPDEGGWQPPEGWNKPGYTMPATIPLEPCAEAGFGVIKKQGELPPGMEIEGGPTDVTPVKAP